MFEIWEPTKKWREFGWTMILTYCLAATFGFVFMSKFTSKTQGNWTKQRYSPLHTCQQPVKPITHNI